MDNNHCDWVFRLWVGTQHFACLVLNPLITPGSLVNAYRRFIARQKMFRKSATIIDWKNVANFKCVILFGPQPGVPSYLSYRTKLKGKRVGRKRKEMFQVKATSFKNITHKPTRKASRVIRVGLL